MGCVWKCVGSETWKFWGNWTTIRFWGTLFSNKPTWLAVPQNVRKPEKKETKTYIQNFQEIGKKEERCPNVLQKDLELNHTQLM